MTEEKQNPTPDLPVYSPEERTVTIKEFDFYTIQNAYLALGAFRTILNDRSTQAEYTDCGKIIALIHDRLDVLECFKDADRN